VQGLTLEGRFNYNQKLQLETGYTLQTARFDAPIAWSAELPGTRDYLRTPNQYGFFTLTILPEGKLNGSLSGVYTGKMKVPHFGGAPGVERDELVTSPVFWELNSKLSYRLHLHRLETDVEFSAGVQNIFNAYQSDFDLGKYRDSNYIYGPGRPRVVFVGCTVKL
jgi:outer membrane receptor for ferrienterochelin and colicins